MEPKQPSTFVTTISLSLAEKMLSDLRQQGFEITTPQYTVFSAKKKGISCTLYQSGKLMIQGKEMGPFIEFYLEPQIMQSFDYSYQDLKIDQSPHIGIDESGKGDFFGPLCVAGVYAQGEQILRLKSMGVCDSKRIADSQIKKLGTQIRKEFVHHIVRINPLKYNELIQQFGNLNRLLAWGHATTIEQLYEKTQCKKVVIDQFANEHVVLTALKRKRLNLDLTQRHRAEEDLVVAAASILARQTFVEALESFAEEYQMEFPKGASSLTIKAGKKFLNLYGKENLGKVAKLHFKTLDSILPNRPE